MRRKFILALTLGFLAVASCEEYEYTIEMRFEDGRIVRKAICSENMPDDVRAKLKEIYEKQIDKNTFEGSFSGRLPPDVGGFGNCIHLNNPMGQVYIYHERFRGKDEQAKDLQHAFTSVDKLLDLVIEWLEMELGDHKDFAKLKTFCTTQLRSDLKNICIYTWRNRQMSKPDSHEAIFRIMQYLYEREYFTLDDVSRFLVSQDVNRNILAMFRHIIARKMGYENEEPITKELLFLATEENLMKSVHHFLQNSDTIRKILVDLPESEKVGKDAADPNTIAELVLKHYEIDFESFFFDLSPSRDQVNVTLHIPHKPYETNGQWDENKRQVTWSRKIRRKEVLDIPFFCYAAFAQANENYQTKHIGRMILKDDELTLYSFWYKGLTTKQQQEWDQCLAKLKAMDIAEKLKAFRFSDIPESHKNSKGESIYPTDTALELILGGLEKHKE
jgi:hypothetical protein